MANRPNILREYRVVLVPADEAEPQEQYPKNLGKRTKCGGQPDSLQRDTDEGKVCPHCSGPMHFVAQIDSFEFDYKGNPHRKPYREAHFMFGDVGMIYIWFCFKCGNAEASTECY